MSNTWSRNIVSVAAKVIGFQNMMRFSGQKLFLPFYHAVSDVSLPHISPLYPHKSTRQFESDLDFFIKHFEPISLQEVHETTLGEKKLSKPSFHLTFDDGLREVLTEIAPILKKRGIPATVFVNPSFVGNKALFFRYKAALLIDKLSSSKGNKLPVFPFDENIKQVGDWANWILSVTYNEAKSLDVLAKVLELDFQDFLQKQKTYLDLEELKSLSEFGIEIGAHSLDHPLYRLISEEEQIRQTSESLFWVKENFRPGTLAFSFPFTDSGIRKSFFENLAQSESAPHLIFGTAGLNKELTANHLQRIVMEKGSETAESILSTSLFSFQLKKMMRKEYVQRNS